MTPVHPVTAMASARRTRAHKGWRGKTLHGADMDASSLDRGPAKHTRAFRVLSDQPPSECSRGTCGRKPFDLRSVAPVDALLGMHVDPPHLRDRLVVVLGLRGHWALRDDQAQRRL